MSKNKEILARLIIGMRDAYAKGENAMAWARDNLLEGDNELISTLIAYDLQAGTYVDDARQNPEYVTSWCKQLAKLVKPYLTDGCDILEVGVGEATTLTGVQLIDNGDYFYVESVGIAYPVLKGIPLLSPNHAVIASKLS